MDALLTHEVADDGTWHVQEEKGGSYIRVATGRCNIDLKRTGKEMQTKQ